MVPDINVVEIVFDTELPWVTDLAPPLEREKSKGEVGGIVPPPAPTTSSAPISQAEPWGRVSPSIS